MTASQKSRLGQGLFFGLFFVVLGLMIREWSDRGTAPYYGGTIGVVAGVVILLWGAYPFYKARRQRAGS